MGYNTAAGRAEITAVAAQEDFDFVFKIYTDEDIIAWLTPTGEDADEVADLLTLDVDYTVSVNGDDGGVFTLLSAATAGDSVTLVRSLSSKRFVEFAENGDLRPSVLNSDQNYQTYLIADVLTSLDSVLKLPTNVQGVSGELPAPVGDAYIKWAADGLSLENDTTIPDAVIAAAASAAAALQSAEDAAAAALAAAGSEDATELDKWIAHASVLTAASYAVEAEDVEVNLVTSDGDGMFTYTPQTGVYSSKHHAIKSAASALGSAANISTDTANFDGVLSGSDTDVQKALETLDDNIPDKQISTVASSVLLNQDSLSIANTAVTKNFASKLYTGNGGSNEIITAIDSGDLVDGIVDADGRTIIHDRTTGDCIIKVNGTPTESGTAVLNISNVHIKSRSDAHSHIRLDGARGGSDYVFSDLTNAEASSLTISFTSTGFTLLGGGSTNNGNTKTYVSYQTLYTHIVWGLTNHGKRYLIAYNPVTRMMLPMWIGSGLAGHKIPNPLGVAIDYMEVKGLDSVRNWKVYSGNKDESMALDLTSASGANTAWNNTTPTNSYITLGAVTGVNEDGLSHIGYARAKSEVWTSGTYIGTGAAGNFIETLDINGNARKPRRIVIKRTSDVQDWLVYDSERRTNEYTYLELNTSDVENTNDINRLIFNVNGFILNSGFGSVGATNVEDETYHYEVHFDTNSDGGDSYFDLPTDDANLTLTASLHSYTDGLGDGGLVKSLKTSTKSIDFTGVSDGLKYTAEMEDDTTFDFSSVGGERHTNSLSAVSFPYMRSVGLYDKQSADDNRLVFDSETGKHYLTTGGELASLLIADWDATGYSTFENVGDILHFIANAQGGEVEQTITGLTIGDTYILPINVITNIADGEFWFNGSYHTGLSASSTTDLNVEFVAEATSISYKFREGSGTDNTEFYINSISLFKTKATLSTETPAISFNPYPIMVASETPMDIRTDEPKIADNVMKDLEIQDDLTVGGLTKLNGNVRIVDFGTVAVNSKYVVDNPFGNDVYVQVEVQLYVNGEWGKVTGYTDNTGSAEISGVVGGFISGVGIVVRTAEDHIVYVQPDRFPSVLTPTVTLATAPCRCIVTYIGEVTDA